MFWQVYFLFPDNLIKLLCIIVKDFHLIKLVGVLVYPNVKRLLKTVIIGVTARKKRDLSQKGNKLARKIAACYSPTSTFTL